MSLQSSLRFRRFIASRSTSRSYRRTSSSKAGRLPAFFCSTSTRSSKVAKGCHRRRTPNPSCWFDRIHSQKPTPNAVETYSLSLCRIWSKSPTYLELGILGELAHITDRNLDAVDIAPKHKTRACSSTLLELPCLFRCICRPLCRLFRQRLVQL